MSTGITVHQRIALWLWHWKSGPGWVRNPWEMNKLRADGARVLRVQLQDDGPVDLELVKMWKSIGFKVWGAIRPSGYPLAGPGATWDPLDAAFFAKEEKRRLALHGMDFNFEDDVRRADLETNGKWSDDFANAFRQWCPRLPCALDTYWGAAGGGLNLGAYVTRGFRMNVQTYWGAEGLWDDPPTRIVQWCKGASPSIPKAIVKPILRVTANNAGERLYPKVAIADAKAAGTKGLALYYIDGAELEYLRAFIRDAIADGVAY